MAIIYNITNLINNKVYIGETIRSLNARWTQHKNQAFCKKSNRYLYQSMRKYGLENFKIEVLEYCFIEDRFKREAEYIKQYNSLIPNGYNNIMPIKASNPQMVETIIQEWEKGYSIIEISNILHIDAKQISNYLKGSGVTDEDIKIRKKEKAKNRNGKIVYRFNITGEFIDSFASASEAARKLLFNHASISKCCKGDLITYNNYIWLYNEEDLDERLYILQSLPKTGKNNKKIYLFYFCFFIFKGIFLFL